MASRFRLEVVPGTAFRMPPELQMGNDLVCGEGGGHGQNLSLRRRVSPKISQSSLPSMPSRF